MLVTFSYQKKKEKHSPYAKFKKAVLEKSNKRILVMLLYQQKSKPEKKYSPMLKFKKSKRAVLEKRDKRRTLVTFLYQKKSKVKIGKKKPHREKE